MLQVAVRRLNELFPSAQIQVLCHDPEKLQELCPAVRGLSVKGRDDWFMPGSQLGRLQRFSPSLERRIRRVAPALSQRLTRLKRRLQRRGNADACTFFDALQNADLVVATGGGYLNSTFPAHAYATLEMLDLAVQMGKPVALLGQGIGPFDKPGLRSYAARVLPRVSLIGLREGLKSSRILSQLGVNTERVIVTGDDAIELAFSSDENASADLGAAIGVNLRVASYSQIGAQTVELVREELHRAARQFEASLVPVPISFYPQDFDPGAICELLRGLDDASDGGAALSSPLQVIEEVKRCRIVVTGSYHAAIFALSQGISVVGLAQSEYYVGKFGGLQHQFGTGCQMIVLDDPAAAAKLRQAIEQGWQKAPARRGELLEAARRQIESSHALYQQLPVLTSS